MAEKKPLSPAELKALKAKMLGSVENEKFQLVVNYPFIGGIALHLEFVPVRDMELDTAATDGSKIYFDMDFYASLTESERCFIIAHETWHCVMLHFLRKQTRDPKLFNIATDMEVNRLIKDSAEDSTFHPPSSALFPPTHLSKSSAEELYEWLLAQSKPQSGGGGQNGQSGGQGGQNSRNQSNQGNNRGNDPYSCGGSSSNNSKNQNGKGQGKFSGQWDKHNYDDGDNGDDGQNGGQGQDGPPQDRWGAKGHDPDYQPQIQEGVSEKIREAVIAEAQKQERSQGHLPSCIEQLVNQYRKPEIRWQEELAQFVTIVYGDHRRWLPPNRRHVHHELYLQSRRDERIKVVVAVDTSGSCVGDLPKFFGELVSLINSFGDYEIDVIYADAAVHKVDHYDRNEPFVDADGFQWQGGGGTSFCPPFEYMEEHGIIPDCFIYFTDGYGDAPDVAPSFPVLWVLTSDGSRDFCNWGKKIRFRTSSYENQG